MSIKDYSTLASYGAKSTISALRFVEKDGKRILQYQRPGFSDWFDVDLVKEEPEIRITRSRFWEAVDAVRQATSCGDLYQNYEGLARRLGLEDGRGEP